MNHINALKSKLHEMCQLLKKSCEQRKTDIKSFKLDTIITSGDYLEYNKSAKHVKKS